ncbi:MAG TPA: hypothetical protein VLQ52_05655, partial [Coriobacteriia bacterium]|nr:hypothetical protein [Coriobacteriia bacterium]
MWARRTNTMRVRAGAAVLAVTLLFTLLLSAGCDRGMLPEPLEPLPEASRERTEPDPEPDGAPAPVPTPLEPTPVEPDPPSTPEPDDDAVHGWYYTANSTHAAPTGPAEALRLLNAYGGRYIGTDAGVVYLTFDEGYEN